MLTVIVSILAVMTCVYIAWGGGLIVKRRYDVSASLFGFAFICAGIIWQTMFWSERAQGWPYQTQYTNFDGWIFAIPFIVGGVLMIIAAGIRLAMRHKERRTAREATIAVQGIPQRSS